MQFTVTVDIPSGVPPETTGTFITEILSATVTTLSNSLHVGDQHRVRNTDGKPVGHWAVTRTETPAKAQTPTVRTALSAEGKALIERAARKMHASSAQQWNGPALGETAGLLTYLSSLPDTEQTPWAVQRLLADGERIARSYVGLPVEVAPATTSAAKTY